MRIHYRGKFNGDMDSLPKGNVMPGDTPFSEPETQGELVRAAAAWSMAACMPAAILLLVLGGGIQAVSGWGILLAFAMALPHEFLHAVCFRQDVYIYTDLRQGMLFVTGPESMSRRRFVFMSLLPNIVFGLVPMLIFLSDLGLTVLGTMGAVSLSMSGGDFLNVSNALRQMPPGALTHLRGFHSWWYMPEDQE